MKLEQIEDILLATAHLTNHRNFAVVGSLSILNGFATKYSQALKQQPALPDVAGKSDQIPA